MRLTGVLAVTMVAAVSAVGAHDAQAGEAAPAVGRAWQAGDSLCVLLGPGDFTPIAGLAIAAPEDNGDGAGGHYCLYTPGRYPIKGGIEFDAFVGPDAESTFATVIGELAQGRPADAGVPGADASTLALAGPVTTSIAVRRGALVFAISLPQSAQAEAELRRLAAMVLARAANAIAD